tara:strand:- start:848 stop:1078 length:231 start_codon:yes stop_codon:yes gene_type:complete
VDLILLKEGDLVIIKRSEKDTDEFLEKVAVFIKYVYDESLHNLLPDGISGWECLVEGEVGVYLTPYWEVSHVSNST